MKVIIKKSKSEGLKRIYLCLMYLAKNIQWIQVIIAKRLIMALDCL